jgi:hypothetical protein
MTKNFTAALIAVVALSAGSSALAQGHVAGAVVGGAIGAHSHHAVAGAVVGGAVGHHMAKKRAAKQARAAGPQH